MWPFADRQKYTIVATAEDGEELKRFDEEYLAGLQPRPRPLRRSLICCAPVIISILALLVFGVFALNAFHLEPTSPDEQPSNSQDQSTPAADRGCQVRREWRTLTIEQNNSTASDDFPWIHSHVGYATHHSAPFLPWHRYFLHIYETTLKDKCGYTGGLVYWDWTLDFQAIENSPVFDPDTGFGGDGETDGEITVGRSGRCVADGPFAGIQIDFYDVKYQPHCLSRGFRDLEGNLGHIVGSEISPDSIKEVLTIDKYEDFVSSIESKIHDVIPFGIAGDFETFTAPYDPLFFLHHTQLDRLWWMWQQRQPGKGLEAYGGHKERHSIEMASLHDDLHYKGLAMDVKVGDVMDVEGELLCYRY